MSEAPEPDENAATADPRLTVPPQTIAKFAKVLYYLVESVALGVGIAHYDWQAAIAGTGGSSSDPPAGSWRQFVMTYIDADSLDNADAQQFTVDVVNITNGQLDPTWNDGDYNFCAGQFQTFMTAIVPLLATRMHSLDIKIYERAFNPYSNIKPFAPTGPPVKVYPHTANGTGGGSVPPQGSSTVTELTPLRKHWGRFYLPTIGAAAIDTTGRLTVAAVDALATAANTLYDGLMSAQFFPVVPTTQSEKQPLRSLQTVTGVKVDDVMDVQRSRRHAHPLHAKQLPVPTATTTAAA